MSNKYDFYNVEESRMMRAEYIAKTLYTLSIQLFFTFGSLILVSNVDVIKEYFIKNMGEMSGIGMIGSFVVLFWMIGTTHQTSFQLGLFTIFQTLALCSISILFNYTALISVIGLTLAITTGLAITAYFSERISNNTEQMMFNGLTILLVCGLMNLLFENQMFQTIELFAGTLLFAVYILLDVQRTIDRNISPNCRKDIHIMACLNIYLDIINLFIRLLQIYSLYEKKKKQ